MKRYFDVVPLSTLCTIKSGKSDTKDAVVDGQYAFFDRSKTIKKSSRYLYDCEALIVPGEGAEFLPKHFVGKFDLHQRAYALFDFSTSIHVRYLYFYLHHRDDYLPAVAVGATVKSLRMRHFEQFPIAVTSFPEQQRIVGILDEAFAGIATAKANAKKNLQNARDLFDSHLNAVFSRRGEGWRESTIGEVCTLKSGNSVSQNLERQVGEIPYLKVSDMNIDGNEDKITTSSRFLRRADVKDNAIIPPGATIFPKRGGAILTNKKRITALAVCADLNIMAVVPTALIDPAVLYLYFLKLDMRSLGSGSSIPQVNNYDVAPLPISFPESLLAQQELALQLNSLRTQTQRLARVYEQKLAALDVLKRSLLHQAFTGQL